MFTFQVFPDPMLRELLQRLVDEACEIFLVRFVRNYGMNSSICLIVRCNLLVEAQNCGILVLPLEDGDAGVIAGGFDCEGKEVTALYTALN